MRRWSQVHGQAESGCRSAFVAPQPKRLALIVVPAKAISTPLPLRVGLVIIHAVPWT